MRILQINAVYGIGSTGRLVREMHETLSQRGFESYLATCSSHNPRENGYVIGNIVDRKFHALFSHLLGLQGYYSKKATKKLLKYIDTIKPDIVHLHNLHNNYINLVMLLEYLTENEIGVVLTLHDNWFYTGKCTYYFDVGCYNWQTICHNCPAVHMGNKSYIFDRSKKMFTDKKMLFSKIKNLTVVGMSQWLMCDIEKSLLKTAKRKVLIYNWVDSKVFKPLETACLKDRLCDRYGIHKDKKIILGVSYFWDAIKGIDLFYELADLIADDFQIVLIGKKNDKYCHKNINYIGTINDKKELADLYNIADVFVNPSERETFGLTTVEALSCGIPVVALDRTALPDVVGTDGKCGFLLFEKNAEMFLQAINAVCSEDKEKFAVNCRARVELMFSKEKNIDKYISVYKNILEESQ